jgi:hypothetical protein
MLSSIYYLWNHFIIPKEVYSNSNKYKKIIQQLTATTNIERNDTPFMNNKEKQRMEQELYDYVLSQI